MNALQQYFSRSARFLHWTLSILIITMLFIGVGMVSTITEKHAFLLNIHKPLGILIFILVIVRIMVRLTHKPPALPALMPRFLQQAAYASHVLLYALMFAMPLVGWAMLSAGNFPITLGTSSLHLFPIAPHDLKLFGWLRLAHTWLAYLLVSVIVLHVSAALTHAFIFRDGVFQSMAGIKNKEH